MRSFLRPVLVALCTAAVTICLVVAPQSADDERASLYADRSTVVTSTDHIQHVGNVTEDCLTAATLMIGGLEARGIKLAWDLKSVGAHLAALTSAFPGTRCATWAGERNIQAMCWLSRQSGWVPGRGTARWMIWLITDGQIYEC